MPHKTIWKFQFDVSDRATLLIPSDSQFLSVGSQGPNTIAIWAIVDPDSPKLEFTFEVFGTGFSIDEGLTRKNHLGTVFDGQFVWHVFDLTPDTHSWNRN